MKRLLSVLMALTMVIGLFACLGVTALADEETDTTILVTGDLSDDYTAVTAAKQAYEAEGKTIYLVSAAGGTALAQDEAGYDLAYVGSFDEMNDVWGAGVTDPLTNVTPIYQDADDPGAAVNSYYVWSGEDEDETLVYAVYFVAVNADTTVEDIDAALDAGMADDLANYEEYDYYVIAIGSADALEAVDEDGQIDAFVTTSSEEELNNDYLLDVTNLSVYNGMAELTLTADGSITVGEVETPEVETTPEPTEAPETETTPEPTETPETETTPEPTETPEAETTPEPTETPETETTPEPEEIETEEPTEPESPESITLYIEGMSSIEWTQGSGEAPTITAEQRVTAVYLKYGEETTELTLDEDYTLSEDGLTVTLTTEWLDSLFNDEDGIELITSDEPTIVLETASEETSGDEIDPQIEEPTKTELTVTVNTKTVKVRDDAPTLTAEDYTVTGLADGDTATVAYVESPDTTTVGDQTVKVTVTVTDADGNDVTDNYSIPETTATVTVVQRKLTVTANKNLEAKTGDPTPDVTGAYTTVQDELKAGDTITVVVNYATTPQMNVAETVTIKIDSVTVKDADGNDVTADYDITKNDGTLTVTEAETTKSTDTTTIKVTWNRPNDYSYTFDKEIDSFYYYNPKSPDTKLTLTEGTDYTISGNTLTLKANGAIGKWADTGTSYHPFAVKFTDGTTMEFRLILAGGAVTTTTTTDTTTTETTATPAPTATASSGGTAAATGDETPIGTIIAIVVVLAVALVVVVVLANKSKKKAAQGGQENR